MPRDLDADRRLLAAVQAVLGRDQFAVLLDRFTARVSVDLPRSIKEGDLRAVAAFVKDSPAAAADAHRRLAWLKGEIEAAYVDAAMAGDANRAFALGQWIDIARGAADVPEEDTP